MVKPVMLVDALVQLKLRLRRVAVSAAVGAVEAAGALLNVVVLHVDGAEAGKP
jgi:hypothetical protein